MDRCQECGQGQPCPAPIDGGNVWRCNRCGFEWAKGPDAVWEFALRAIEVALDTIVNPLERLEATQQLGWSLSFARSLAPCDDDPVEPLLRAVTR